MDRAPSVAQRAWSLLIVPRTAAAGIRRLDLEAGAVWRLRAAAAGLVLTTVALGAVVALSMPRLVAYPNLVEQNLAMRSQLRGVDRQLESVDGLLLRLRAYEAQLRGVTDGGHGPLDAPSYLGSGVGSEATPWVETSRQAAQEAELRSDQVAAELSALQSVLSLAEDDVRGLVGEALALRALEASLPSSWPAKGFVSSEFGYRRSPFSKRW